MNGSLASLSMLEKSTIDATGDPSLDVTNGNDSQKILFTDMESPE